jgi:hypothetical protein
MPGGGADSAAGAESTALLREPPRGEAVGEEATALLEHGRPSRRHLLGHSRRPRASLCISCMLHPRGRKDSYCSVVLCFWLFLIVLVAVAVLQ